MSITLFNTYDFNPKGKSVTLIESCPNLRSKDFDDKTASVSVASGTWLLYEDADFRGRYFCVGPGDHNGSVLFNGIGNVDTISSVRLVSNKITLFTDPGFQGMALPLTESAPNFDTFGYNDQASSVHVEFGTWVLYEHVDYKGKSMHVIPGSYDVDLISAGIGNNIVSSVKLATAEIILYEFAGFKGRAVPLTQSVHNLSRFCFDNATSAIVVVSGKWRLFEEPDYKGKSHRLGPGCYDCEEVKKLIGDNVVSSVGLDDY